MSPALDRRSCGLLLHPTSLPGPFGVGDLGPEARKFANFLARAGQGWWQMLPIVPHGPGDSPYLSSSAFAGSPLLISLEDLAAEGLLDSTDLRAVAGAPGRADFGAAWKMKELALKKAFARFKRGRTAKDREGLRDFRQKHEFWLEDFALFKALSWAYRGRPWTAWEPDLSHRRGPALIRAAADLSSEISFEVFLQFKFDSQWRALRDFCGELGVGMIGDVPIFVAHDSADVWAHREFFALDAAGVPAVVAGVPPDYFSKTGQLWGNPLYDWQALRRQDYSWWAERLRAAFERFDVVRLDHFIGFCRYWEIPAGSETAAPGRWVPGPGAHFFERLSEILGPLPLIAEDLGVVGDDVKALRDRFDFPGMRVLQFAFGSDPEAANYQPANFIRNCVVYTGTHDNDTTVGWFKDEGGASSTRSALDILKEREHVLRALGTDGKDIHWDMIRLAYESLADTAIVPAQDAVGLGSEARMNLPGTSSGNWAWRLKADELNAAVAERLRALAESSGRTARIAVKTV